MRIAIPDRKREAVEKDTLRAAPLVFAIGLFAAFVAGVASADSIGGPGSLCESCQGALYTLTYSGAPLVDADPLNETYRITLTIDTSTLDLPGAVAIDAAAIKVSSAVSGASLFDATGDAASWNIVPGGVDGGGCSGSGGGFSCADWIAAGVGTPVGGTIEFIFDHTMSNGALFTGLNQASIKVRYVDTAGDKIGDLVSEAITLQPSVPEPTGALVFAVGVAIVGSSLRRNSAA
jgi:hypothetical protein